MTTCSQVADSVDAPQVLVLEPPKIAEARVDCHNHIDERFMQFIKDSVAADEEGAAAIERGEYVSLAELRRLVKEA